MNVTDNISQQLTGKVTTQIHLRQTIHSPKKQKPLSTGLLLSHRSYLCPVLVVLPLNTKPDDIIPPLRILQWFSTA